MFLRLFLVRLILIDLFRIRRLGSFLDQNFSVRGGVDGSILPKSRRTEIGR